MNTCATCTHWRHAEGDNYWPTQTGDHQPCAEITSSYRPDNWNEHPVVLDGWADEVVAFTRHDHTCARWARTTTCATCGHDTQLHHRLCTAYHCPAPKCGQHCTVQGCACDYPTPTPDA